MTADSQNKQFFDAAAQRAFPVSTIDGFTEYGLTARQYAAIKLRVPDSGDEWLDVMIRTSLRDEFAGKAMQAMASDMQRVINMVEHCKKFGVSYAQDLASQAYDCADVMIAERAK